MNEFEGDNWYPGKYYLLDIILANPVSSYPQPSTVKPRQLVAPLHVRIRVRDILCRSRKAELLEKLGV